MRRKWLYLSGSFLITAVLIFVLRLPFFIVKSSTVINASLDEVASQFNKPQNWKNWYPDFTVADSIRIQNPVSVTHIKNKDGKLVYAYIAAASAGYGTKTVVAMTTKVNGMCWLRNRFAKNEQEIPDYLKSFMEDDSRRYGFPMTIIPVSDTLILTTRKIVAPIQRLATISTLRGQLQRFMASNNLRSTAKYYFVSFLTAPEGKIEIDVGIPVAGTRDPQPGFEFLKLPKNGRLLAGQYEGPLKDRTKLYTALDKYILNKRLKKVAQPIEKYSCYDTLISEGQHIRATVYYPIY